MTTQSHEQREPLNQKECRAFSSGHPTYFGEEERLLCVSPGHLRASVSQVFATGVHVPEAGLRPRVRKRRTQEDAGDARVASTTIGDDG